MRRVLRWLYDRSPDLSRDPLRKLDECIYSWDGLYFPLAWKRSFKDGERVVSARLVASLAVNPENWWGTPAAATFCADSGVGEITERDWKFHLQYSVVILEDPPQCPDCGRGMGKKWTPESHCGTEESGPLCEFEEE